MFSELAKASGQNCAAAETDEIEVAGKVTGVTAFYHLFV